jgi:hypothetical protein
MRTGTSTRPALGGRRMAISHHCAARGHWPVRLLAACALVLLLPGLAAAEEGAHVKGRQDLQQRFELRGSTAAGFLESYTSYVLDSDRTLAENHLSGPVVTDAQFHDFVDRSGFGATVLLDATGHDLNLVPYRADLIGADLGARHDYLRTALNARPVVSNTVMSAAQSVPVVAFATPFNTPYGRRLISGAYDITSRPMGIYLRHLLPYASSAVYLIDGTGRIIAANTTASGRSQGLTDGWLSPPTGTSAAPTSRRLAFAAASPPPTLPAHPGGSS